MDEKFSCFGSDEEMKLAPLDEEIVPTKQHFGYCHPDYPQGNMRDDERATLADAHHDQQDGELYKVCQADELDPEIGGTLLQDGADLHVAQLRLLLACSLAGTMSVVAVTGDESAVRLFRHHLEPECSDDFGEVYKPVDSKDALPTEPGLYVWEGTLKLIVFVGDDEGVEVEMIGTGGRAALEDLIDFGVPTMESVKEPEGPPK